MTHSSRHLYGITLGILVFCTIPVVTVAEDSFATFSGETRLTRGIYVSPTSDGGFILAGTTLGENGIEDICVLKLDSGKAIEWDIVVGGEEADLGWHVSETSAGQYIVAGTSGSFGAKGSDFILFTLDSKGKLIWQKLYGGPGDEYGWAALAMPDGDICILGDSTSESAGKRDALVVRCNSSGEEKWRKRVGKAGEDRLFSILPAPDGGILAGGLTDSIGAGERDVYLLHIDKQGELVWEKTFGEVSLDLAHGLVQADDEYVAVGYSGSFGAQGHDPLIVFFDANGTISGHEIIKLPGIDHAITGVLTTSDLLVLTGFSSQTGGSFQKASLVVLDKKGKYIGSKTLTDAGGAMGYTIARDHGTGVVVAGHVDTREQGRRLLFAHIPSPLDFVKK